MYMYVDIILFTCSPYLSELAGKVSSRADGPVIGAHYRAGYHEREVVWVGPATAL